MARKSKSIKRLDQRRFAEAFGISCILFAFVGLFFGLLYGWMVFCNHLTSSFRLSFVESTVVFMSPIVLFMFLFTLWASYESLD